MVLDHNAVEKKGRVVLLVLVDPQAQLAGNDPVGLGLTPVQPDVDVPERTVRRNGIGKAQSVTFEEHHRKAVFVVECRETRDGRFVTAVAFLDLLDVESPLQQQCPRRTQLARATSAIHPKPPPRRPAPTSGGKSRPSMLRRIVRKAPYLPSSRAAPPAAGRTKPLVAVFFIVKINCW